MYLKRGTITSHIQLQQALQNYKIHTAFKIWYMPWFTVHLYRAEQQIKANISVKFNSLWFNGLHLYKIKNIMSATVNKHMDKGYI